MKTRIDQVKNEKSKVKSEDLVSALLTFDFSLLTFYGNIPNSA